MFKQVPLFVRQRNDSGQRGGDACFSNSSVRAVRSIALGFAFLFVLAWAQPKASAQVTILHNFGDSTIPNDGLLPEGGLIQAPDGNFYGGTLSNVTTSGATIFQMTPGAAVTTIQTFAKGSSTYDPPVYDNGKLITIVDAAFAGNATLFALTESAKGVWSKVVWYKFSLKSGGAYNPIGNPVLAKNGDLYGATFDGGTKHDGTIYKVNPTTRQFTVISNFKAPNPGQGPFTALVQATNGDFYGGTSTSTTFGGFHVLHVFWCRNWSQRSIDRRERRQFLWNDRKLRV
jgi:uncharacterized repeat protein (TIGR03803 family)